MKITAIKQQVKQKGRYSIYIDGKYSFSLSEGALLETKLVNGQELTEQQAKAYQRLSGEDKLYNRALQYVAIRPRSIWEVEFYLQRKQASPTLVTNILNKLSELNMIGDEQFAQAFVNDRRLLRPASRRKIITELRRKHVPAEVIEKVVGNEAGDEQTALQEVIARKRRQSKYQDDLKLMQYLARQGFSYGDIKAALDQ